MLPEDSPLVGKTVADLEALGDGEVTVTGIIREQSHRYVPRPHWTLYAGDILVLQGDPTALQPVVDQAKLKLLGADEMAALKPRDKDDVLETVEAVIAPDSLLIGNTPQDLRLRQNYEVNLLALSRADEPTSARLRSSRFAPGDIVVLQGRQGQLARALTELGLLPLAERNLAIGRPRWRWMPLLILLAAMIAIATGVVAVEVGFFVAATLIVLLRLVTPREAYDAVEWPIIVMLGCLIPVGEALKDTGAAGLMADGLTVIAAQLPAYLAVGLIMVVSMLVTPLLHHAAAVLLMGPVAAAVAKNLGLGPDAFLMAVAFGAASDFLTPIGHQNSTLVMGPGGYRFSDYWRLGSAAVDPGGGVRDGADPADVAAAIAWSRWVSLRCYPSHVESVGWVEHRETHRGLSAGRSLRTIRGSRACPAPRRDGAGCCKRSWHGNRSSADRNAAGTRGP